MKNFEFDLQKPTQSDLLMKKWYLLLDLAVISVFAVCRSNVIKTSFERKPFSRRTSNFWIWGVLGNRIIRHPGNPGSIHMHPGPFHTVSNHFKPFQKPFQTISNQFEPVLGVKWTFHDDLYNYYVSMIFYRFLRKPIEIHGCPWITHKLPWTSMDIHGIPVRPGLSPRTVLKVAQ